MNNFNVNHSYSDEELTERILTLAKHDLANLYHLKNSLDDRCLCFGIYYAPEEFFLDLLEVRKDQKVGWFLKNGFLYVYKGVKNE